MLLDMKKQSIKIFDAEINTTMSLKSVLKICRTIDDTSINDGEDVEEHNYTFIHVSKHITKTSTRQYEIIFHDGKIQSVEWWDIQVIYSAVPIKKIKKLVT